MVDSYDDFVAKVKDEPTAEEAVASEPEDAEVVEEAAPVVLEEPKRWQVRAKEAYPFHGEQFTAHTEEEVRAKWHKIYGEDYAIETIEVIE